jgi:2-polyprenyl-3-methyl-5-hydroxy-6-metoxy-1,4-benzoquinol methylase
MKIQEFKFIYKGEQITLTMNLDDLNDPRTQMILRVKRNSRVLEFGCNTGFCSSVLLERGCDVTGVDIDPEAGDLAKKHCTKVIIADVENDNFEEEIMDEEFDYILLGGFIEHLKAPDKFLSRVGRFLKEDGSIILYVPNIAHWSVRMDLLKGCFDYQPTGLLDSTHLIHFTKNTLFNMIDKCGYDIVHYDSVRVPILEDDIRKDLLDLGLNCEKELIEYFKRSEADVYIHVAEAKLRK